jgi:hypothetical protein
MATLTKSQAKLDRWISIMQSCDTLGFLTTSQIQRLHNLSSRRNTLRVLNDMGDYLNSFHDVGALGSPKLNYHYWMIHQNFPIKHASNNLAKDTFHSGFINGFVDFLIYDGAIK